MYCYRRFTIWEERKNMTQTKNDVKPNENGGVITIIETKNKSVKNTWKNTIKIKISNNRWKHWTSEEDQKLKELIDKGIHYYQMMEIFDRSWNSISDRARKLNLSKRVFKISVWSSEEENLLRHYVNLNYPFWKIASLLNKSIKSIQYKAKTLNLVTPTFLKRTELNSFKNKYGDTELTRIINKRYHAAKSRAKEKNIEFNITKDFLIELYNKQKGLCYYSGFKMRTSVENRNRNNTDSYSISIERLDSLKGYIDTNIVLCCNVINLMKNGLIEKEFLDICKNITSYRVHSTILQK